MNKMISKGFFLNCIACFSVLISCVPDVTREKALEKQQYEFAAAALKAYFIFQERLPADLYSFLTPQDLYNSVNDPYTVFYTRNQAEILRNYWLTTRVAGIGVVADSVENGYVLKDVFKGSPAQAAGLLKGDTVISVDGVSIVNLSQGELSSLIRGEPGEPVRLTVKRLTQELTFDIVRAEFNSPSVFIDSLAENVAYIYLAAFVQITNIEGGSAREFVDALDLTSWAEYTVFDLRENGGGEISQCIRIISQFVPSGTPVMEFVQRVYDENNFTFKTEKEIYRTEGGGAALNRKFIILADTLTASASEILISCLRDHRSDIKFIGQHTYGKACGQVLLDGPDLVMAKITSIMLAPLSGDSYDKTGLMPDIAINSGDAVDTALGLIGSGSLSKKRVQSVKSRKKLTDVERPWNPLLIVKDGGE